ncbi:hypothetical protein FG386_002163 [Cryptosporidium ryanae]|uniref:uncharacterized protein n=1 Tax=Cryptosporidium ryanae TaxID=515981 RepID=UPI00351A3CA6|nr:hypothetical protein FG386_002163 [Cryptosporidium ryanae]
MDPYLYGNIARNNNYNDNVNTMEREWIPIGDEREHINDVYCDYGDEFEYGDEGSETIESEFRNMNNEGQEDIICCPMEMLHNRRHLHSYKKDKSCHRRSDLSRIPKFRNPWVLNNKCSTKVPKDIPLTFEEAQVIREIWQDTRAQYSPSDGEIEKEYLFEEEYDDDNAERRRMSIVEKGASLVRYSRHYELPTISTIIKSSNPEQFRSRSFSPFTREMRDGYRSREHRRGSNDCHYNERNECYNIRESEHIDTNNEHIGYYERKREFGGNDKFQTNIMRDNMNQPKINSGNGDNRLICGDETTLNVPSFSNINNLETHRNTVQGINSEFCHLATSNTEINSRRATSPDLISSSKSTSRGPPPRIGVLEPMETTGGLISPVNQNRSSILNTPRIGVATPRPRHSRVSSNNNYTENIPVVSPSAKQTVVFHMLPDAENNSSKATIFANPDTNNVVTELHITPGVDINVISTPTGPAIEYEISGGRNAKAHINFSSNPNTDKLMKSSEIPKINLPDNSFSDGVESRGGTHFGLRSGRRGSGNGGLSLSPTERRASGLDEDLNSDRSTINNRRGAFGVSDTIYNNNNGNSSVNHHGGNINHSVKHHSSRSAIQSPESQPDHRIYDDDADNNITSNTKFSKNNVDNNIVNNITTANNGDKVNEEEQQKFDQDLLLNEAIGLKEGYSDNIEARADEQKNDTFYSNSNIEYNNVTKSHPNPFVPIRKTQKQRTGFTGCIINTLTCTKADTAELKTFRALNPVEVVHRASDL